MRSVNIAELKNNLSKFLNQVKQGEEVLIKDRNVPVAKIVPLSIADDEDAQLLQSAAEGKIKLPVNDGGVPDSFWSMPMPKASASAVKLLREERDER